MLSFSLCSFSASTTPVVKSIAQSGISYTIIYTYYDIPRAVSNMKFICYAVDSFKRYFYIDMRNVVRPKISGGRLFSDVSKNKYTGFF